MSIPNVTTYLFIQLLLFTSPFVSSLPSSNEKIYVHPRVEKNLIAYFRFHIIFSRRWIWVFHSGFIYWRNSWCLPFGVSNTFLNLGREKIVPEVNAVFMNIRVAWMFASRASLKALAIIKLWAMKPFQWIWKKMSERQVEKIFFSRSFRPFS